MSPGLFLMKDRREPVPVARVLVEHFPEQRDHLFPFADQHVAATGIFRFTGMSKAGQGVNVMIPSQQNHFHAQSAQAVDHVQQPQRAGAFGEAIATDDDQGPRRVSCEDEVCDVRAAPSDEVRRLERAREGLRVRVQIGKEANALVRPRPGIERGDAS